MMQKDLLLAMELGRKLNVPVPTTAITNEFLTAARGMGWETLGLCRYIRCLGTHGGGHNWGHKMTTNRVKRDIRKIRLLLCIYWQMGAVREFETQVNEGQQQTS